MSQGALVNNPKDAQVLPDIMDPSDVVPAVAFITIDDQPGAMFPSGTEIATWEIAVSKSGERAGLVIMDGDRAPVFDAETGAIGFWLCIRDDLKGSPRFNGEGIVGGIEVTATSTDAPDVTRQITALQRVKNN